MEAPLFCHGGDDGGGVGGGGGQTNKVRSRYVVEAPSAGSSDLVLQPWKLRQCAVVDSTGPRAVLPEAAILELTSELTLLHSKGCALVTSINTTSDSSLTVTTTSLPYHPSILALSVLPVSGGHTNKPCVFELDLSKCSIPTTTNRGGSSIQNCFGPVVVKSRVFFIPRNNNIIWHLVDNRANVLTVRLNVVMATQQQQQKTKQRSLLSLEPAPSSPVTFHSIWMSIHHDPTTNDENDNVIDVQLSKVSRDGLRQLRQCHGMKSSKTVYEQGLPSSGSGGYQGGDSYYFPRLPSSHVVEFMDSDTILLALPSTYLLCYHLPTQTIYPWMTLRSTYQTTSQRRALGVGDSSDGDGRKSRRSTIGEFFGGFFGGTGDDDDDDDEENDGTTSHNRLASAKKKKKKTKTAIVPDYEQEWRTAAADEKRRGRRMDASGHDGEEAPQTISNDDDDEDDDDDDLYDDAIGMDQPSGVAAISVLSPGSSDVDDSKKIVMQTLVFTLHADGTVRKWTCKPSMRSLNVSSNMDDDDDEDAESTTMESPHKHCLPLDVHVLRTMMTLMTTPPTPAPTASPSPVPSSSFWLCRRGPPFPSSREWSTSCDALWLDSKYINDGLQYALVLCVQTRFPTNDYYSLLETLGGSADADPSYNNTIMSMLLHGPTHFTEYGYIPGVTHLNRLKETSVGRLLPLPTQRDNSTVGSITTITGITSLVIVPEEEQPNNGEDEDSTIATVDTNLSKFFVRCSVHALYETETELTTVTNIESEHDHGSYGGETNVIHNDDDNNNIRRDEEDDDDVLMGNSSALVVRNHNTSHHDTSSALTSSATGALLVQYYPSTTTKTSASATVTVHPLSLEQYAMVGWNSLQTASTLCLTSLQEVDTFYLKQMFCPICNPNALRRGGGPPNKEVVLRALSNVCPTFSNKTSSGANSSSSLEAKVLMAIRAWTRSSSSSSSNTAMVIRRPHEEEDAGDGDRSTTTTQQEQHLLKQHCFHWKCLLEAVWLEEMVLRRPLLLSSLERNSGDLVLLRAGVTTRYSNSAIAARNTTTSTINPIIPVLDDACLKVYQQCTSSVSSKKVGSYMATIQQRLRNMIESCQFFGLSETTTNMTNRSPPTLKEVFAYNTTANGGEEDVVNGFDTVIVPLLTAHVKGFNDIMEALMTMTVIDLVEWIEWKGGDVDGGEATLLRGTKMPSSSSTFPSLVYKCQCLLMTYQHKLVIKCLLLLNCMMQRTSGSNDDEMDRNHHNLIQTVALKRLLEVTALQYVLNQPLPNHQNTTTTVLEEQLTYMIQERDNKQQDASLHTTVLHEFVTRYVIPSYNVGGGRRNRSAAATATPEPQPPLESLATLGYRLMMRLLTPTLVYHTPGSTSIEDEEETGNENNASQGVISQVNRQEQFKTMALCLFHEASFIGKYYSDDNDGNTISSMKKLRDLGMEYLQQGESYTLLHLMMSMSSSLKYQEGGGDIVMDAADDNDDEGESPSYNSTNEIVASVWKRLIYLKGSFLTNSNEEEEEEDVTVVAAANDKLHKLLMDFMWSAATTGVFAETEDADQKAQMIQTTVARLVSVHSFASLVRPMMNNNGNTNTATISTMEELLHAASIHVDDFLLYLKWMDTLALRLKAISIVEEHVGGSDGYSVILQTCQHAMDHLEPVLLRVLEQLKQDDVAVGRESMVTNESANMELDHSSSGMDDATATILSDQALLYMNEVATMVEYVNLWSAMFRNAMLGHDFLMAHKACNCNPLRERRLENCRRLIKGMMECGYLTQIITTFSVKPDHEQLSVRELLGGSDDDYSKRNKSDVFYLTANDKWKLIDYYDITTEVLKETANEYLKGNHFEKANEYVMALYSLYVKRFAWRLAATCLNQYVEELSKQIILTSSTLLTSNNSLIQRLLEYMIHASRMASNALHLVDDSHMNQFLIVTSTTLNQTKLMRPNDLERRTTILKSLLCLWNHDQRHRTTKNSEHQNQQAQQRLQLLEEDNIVEALKLLYQDNTGCIQDSLGVAEDVNDAPLQNNQGFQCLLWISEQLASRGYYKDAVSLTLLLSSNKVSTEVFVKALNRVVCDYLVPMIALDEKSNKRKTLHQSPTEAQLLSQISNPKCDVIDSSKKKNPYVRIQVLAMMILKDLVGEHSNQRNGLAVEVARTWLQLTNGIKHVPVWLIELLLYGKYQTFKSNGLFATSPAEVAASTTTSATNMKDDFRNNTTQANANDDCKHPQALMKLYMEHGLLHEATDVVIKVLSLSNHKPQEETKTNLRLPEKGYIEYVPYRTIDWLYEMLRKTHDIDNMKRIEIVLKEHFERLQTMEQGLLSTRRQMQQ